MLRVRTGVHYPSSPPIFTGPFMASSNIIDRQIILDRDGYPDVSVTLRELFLEGNFKRHSFLTGVAMRELEDGLEIELDKSFGHQERIELFRQIKSELLQDYPDEGQMITEALHESSTFIENRKIRLSKEG
jgi:hypothetical protein